MQKEPEGQRVVIVGTGENGAIAYEYFSSHSPHEVVAFTAESPFITDDVYCGLPVVPFEKLGEAYPPDVFRAFIAVSDIKLNRVRSRLYKAVKDAGFSCVSCISDRAFVLGSAQYGENLFAQEFTSLQHNVRIGANVFLSSGTCVGHSSTMEDDCYTGPHAVICGGVTIRRGTFLGANSCILEAVTVAEDCIIGAGAVVLKDTKPGQVYVGSPARPTGRDSFLTAGVAAS
jgi:sugar O-acyltransferase (sialic acid O-acetyltransferase NeuD family)